MNSSERKLAESVQGQLQKYLEKAEASGYTERYILTSNMLISADGSRRYSPDKVAIDDFYPFEQSAREGEKSAVYLIETSDKHRGIVVDEYNIDPNARFTHFMIRRPEDV